jgi:hypothetical protein
MKGALSLALVVAIPALLLGWLYTRTPEGDAKVRRTFRSDALDTSRCPGPKKGSRLPELTASEALRKLNPGRSGTLVVQVGHCSSCLKNDLDAWQKAGAARGYRVAFLTASTEDKVREFSEALPDLTLVQDRDRKLTDWLGGCFTPRAYLFDTHWRLRASQSSAEPDLADPFRDPALKAGGG